jgi:hypothetical protein
MSIQLHVRPALANEKWEISAVPTFVEQDQSFGENAAREFG